MMHAARLADLLRQYGVSIPTAAAENLAVHISEVMRYGERLDLVSDASSPTLVHRHLLDSILGVRALELIRTDSGKMPAVLDLGSGGGFPGVVAAVLRPDWRVILVDSSSRKAGFLLHVASQLSLDNLSVVHGRAEDLPQSAFADILPVDGIISRATAPISVLVRLSIPLLRPGGWCGWWKGPRAMSEMEEAKPLMEKYGLRILSRVVYRLPGQNISREIVAVRHRVEA